MIYLKVLGKLLGKHGQATVITRQICPGEREGLRLESDKKVGIWFVGFVLSVGLGIV